MNFETYKSTYDRDGFVIVRQLLSPGDFAELNRELSRYIREVVPTLPDKHAFYDDKSRPQTQLTKTGTLTIPSDSREKVIYISDKSPTPLTL